MSLKNQKNIICLGEAELLQWTSRKTITLLADRIFKDYPTDENDLSFFGTSSFFKLDDAKARVIVQLCESWAIENEASSIYEHKKIVEIHLDQINEVAPVLPQYERRLEDLGLPIAKWSAEKEWDIWLSHQGAHERSRAISENLIKLGFIEHSFFSDPKCLEILVRNALRPKLPVPTGSDVFDSWSKLISKRDEVLKKMRFDGHCGRTSLLVACLKELIKPSNTIALDQVQVLTSRENDWLFSDITPDILMSLQKLDALEKQGSEINIPLIAQASYLRIFDEINYGQKNWADIFNLIRFIKYSCDSHCADTLLYLSIACLPTEDIYKLNVKQKFNEF